MDVVTWGRDPWSREMLVHVSWSLLYLSMVAGVRFMLVHAAYVWRPGSTGGIGASKPDTTPAPTDDPSRLRVVRHSLAARLFHWVMAAAMLTLLFTAFLPILGFKFAWVTIHWMAGLVLAVAVLYHVVQASFWEDAWSIWLTRDDLEESRNRARRAWGLPAPAPRKAGKYPADNKLYHAVIVLLGGTAIVTGLLMIVRVRTPLWTRNPYAFGDHTVGVVYVLHGLAAVGLVSLTMVHLYFAIRPEKLWITKSMVVGWISGRRYADYYDPRLRAATEPRLSEGGDTDRGKVVR
jgi:cytochrome b subunit of formate dehydrogenase